MEKTNTNNEIFLFSYYVLTFLLLASVLHSHFGFPLDDSWIHQTVARNLHDYHVFGYLPGIRSSGSSSLLWTLILFTNYSLLPFIPPAVFSTVLNAVLLGVIGVLIKRLANLDGMPQTEAWIFALAPALSGNFIWLGMLGMEHVLFVMLSLLTILIWFDPREKGTKSNGLWSGLMISLLLLTRPEGLALAPVLILLRNKAQRSWREVASMVGVASFFAALDGIVNWSTSHSVLPQTMQGRLWLAQNLAGGNANARFLCLAQWFTRFLKTWHIFSGTNLFQTTSKLLLLGLLVLVLVPIVTELIGLYRDQRLRIGTLCLWMLLLDAIYLIVLPAAGQGGRYQPLQLMLLLPLFFAGLYRLGLGFNRLLFEDRPSHSIAVATYALLLATGMASLTTWRGVTIAGIDQINTEHGSMALWLARELPPSAKANGAIAVFDIGRIGYELHGNLIDLGGLTDHTYLPFLQQGRVPEYLVSRSVPYVVLPTNGPDDSGTGLFLHLGDGSLKLLKLKTFCDDSPTWTTAMLATNTATRCQTLFHVQPLN